MDAKIPNSEVLSADESPVLVAQSDIEFLIAGAMENDRKRIRLCAHTDVSDKLHEMLIIHTKETYVRPHKHINKTESIHIIRGLADLVMFDDNGDIIKVVSMGEYSTKKCFYCRISDPYYHTLLIRSDEFVFHETTNGPFNRADTVFPPWAPEGENEADCKAFLEVLERKMKES